MFLATLGTLIPPTFCHLMFYGKGLGLLQVWINACNPCSFANTTNSILHRLGLWCSCQCVACLDGWLKLEQCRMFSCRNSGTHLAKTQLLALFEVPWLYAMAEEPLPKKQKLTHQWLTDQLNDFDEGVKQSVLNHLANFSEDDLKEAPVASLIEILPAELTLVAKQRVALRLEKGIRKTFQPPQHAPWL